ncbi:hypothetical protein CMUS01_15659, partial [Colletotrichum musicola]
DEDVHSSQQDAGFADQEELHLKHDLSDITENTEPAASTAADNYGLAAKADDYLQLESLNRNVFEGTDATLESSYITEQPSVAMDESHVKDHDDSFMPTASTLGHADSSFSSTKQVHFDVDNEDAESSPMLSVHEDSDGEETVEETYNNPFARPSTVGYENQAQSSPNPFARQSGFATEEATSPTPYNPFASRSVETHDETSYNPFARSTTSAAEEFLRSASSQGHREPSQAAGDFLRSASALSNRSVDQGRVSPSNPFARSMSAADESFLPTASTLGRPGADLHDESSTNPFARSTSVASTAFDEEGGDPFVASAVADDSFAPAADVIERRQPTPQVPESMYNNPFARSTSSEASFLPTASTLGHGQVDASYNNPFAAARGVMGGDVDETMFDQSVASIASGQGHPISGLDFDEETESHGVIQASSPLSARHLAPTTLDPIQERYNSELEDMDSDSEDPESLTTSQQLPGGQQWAPAPMPSIAERSRQEFDDSDQEDDWDSKIPQSGQINTLLTTSQYRESPPPPPPCVPSSHGFYQQEAEDSSEAEDHAMGSNLAPPVQFDTVSSSHFGATPAPPRPLPPRVLSSQGQYGQQVEDSSEEDDNEWDPGFTPAQPSTLPTSQFEAVAPRASSSLSQSRYRVEDSDGKDQGVLPSQATAQPFPMATSGYMATPPPPPPPPRAPSSQAFYHQEQAASSEDETPFNEDIARPGQFPISSHPQYQYRAPPPPPPPPRAQSSQGRHLQQLEDSEDEGEDDDWESNAARPGQMQSLSTSQYGATTTPLPPPPRAAAHGAQDRYRQELVDSDSEEEEEEKEEAWDSNANRYGQTTDVTVPINNQFPESISSPMEANPMRAASPLAARMTIPTIPGRSRMRSPSLMQPRNPTETPFTASALRSSSPGLQSHPREEDEEEASDDSWEDVHQRGAGEATLPSIPGFTAPPAPPQLRVDSYEQQWPNASNDQISTASSTYLAPAGPGDFTDTDSQEYATPLASAGFSASSQYTQGALDSPRYPDSTDMKGTSSDEARQPAELEIATAPFGQEGGQEHLEDSDDESDYIGSGSEAPVAAPAFLTQFGAAPTAQHEEELAEPVLEQVIDSFHSDEDDGPKTAMIDEPRTQYASSRFGSSTWRDELRSPTLFGATRHSRSGSLREELQKSLHEGSDTGHPSPIQTRQHEPEVDVQEVHRPEEAHMFGQEAFSQPPAQMYGQDPYAAQQAQMHGDPFGAQACGQPQYSPDLPQAHYGQTSSLEDELQEAEEDSEDEEPEQTTPQLAPQQSSQTPDVGPFALQQEAPVTPARSTPSRGLSNSRHNPDRPQTPPSRAIADDDEDLDPEAFIPRDVTNVPWHARTESVPFSVRSQSTIDSMASSPIHSALHADKHEPVIRDSWPASVHHNLTRPRNDSTLTDRSFDDPFRYDGGGTKALHGASGSMGSASDSSPPRAGTGSSPGSLISRMRGIFEGNQAKHEPASPVRSRPVSGVFHPVGRARASSGVGEDDDHDNGGRRKAGILNEAEDEVDEQSALLRNSVGGLEAN